jgi:RimJ/RimL family protein N-acetyltransferase
MTKIKTGREISIFRQLNYWIDKYYTRRGIMYKCLKLFEKIFIDQGLDYIRAVIDEINIPSVNLVKKLGFKEHDICYFLVDEENHREWDVVEYRKNLKGKDMDKGIVYGRTAQYLLGKNTITKTEILSQEK